MQWIVLGSGTAVPHPERGCAAHLLRAKGKAALFDSGSGTKDRLGKLGLDFRELSHLLYSHFHIDHWADLLTLLFYRANASAKEKAPRLEILGPPGFTAFAQTVLRAAQPDLMDRCEELVWRELSPQDGPYQTDWFTVRAYAVEHGSQRAQAYRIWQEPSPEPPFTLTYSGDSTLCEGLIEACQGVDYLVCECAFPSAMGVKNHMNPEQIKELIALSCPKEVILTHLYPQMLSEGLPGKSLSDCAVPLQVAHDGMRIELSGKAQFARPPY